MKTLNECYQEIINSAAEKFLKSYEKKGIRIDFNKVTDCYTDNDKLYIETDSNKTVTITACYEIFYSYIEEEIIIEDEKFLTYFNQGIFPIPFFRASKKNLFLTGFKIVKIKGYSYSERKIIIETIGGAIIKYDYDAFSEEMFNKVNREKMALLNWRYRQFSS